MVHVYILIYLILKIQTILYLRYEIYIFCNHFQMHCLRRLRNIVVCNAIQRQGCEIILNRNKYEISNRNLFRTLSVTACVHEEKSIAKPLRSTKPKSKHDTLQYFVDIKQVGTLS